MLMLFFLKNPFPEKWKINYLLYIVFQLDGGLRFLTNNISYEKHGL